MVKGGGKAVWYWSCPLNQNRGRIIPHRPHKYVKNPVQDSNPRPQGFGAGALAVEPRRHMILCGRFVEFCRNVTMRFTANKNVSLPANAKATQQLANPTNLPALGGGL